MTTPMILVPTKSISSETSQLDHHLSELDSAMSDILKQDLDDSVKAKKYLLLLQKFLRYNTSREEIRSRPLSVTTVNIPQTGRPKKKIMKTPKPTPRPPSVMWSEEEMPLEELVNESLKNVKSGQEAVRKKRSVATVKRLGRKLSFSPVRTRQWSHYKK